jgi:hypothetical protein
MTTVVRGCGSRQAGGAYACTDLGDWGLPLEAFLLDPPVVIDPDGIGLTPVGVTMIEREGATHLVDWVGSKFYPNVADFVEEVRRHGLSRRLSRKLDFARLTKDSKILLAHSRAHITCHDAYYAGIRPLEVECPTGRHLSVARSEWEMCAGLWWYDVEGGIASSYLPTDPLRVVRRMPAFEYAAHQRPLNRPRRDSDYHVALFMSLPIHRIAVINDHIASAHDETFARARESQLAVTLEEA